MRKVVDDLESALIGPVRRGVGIIGNDSGSLDKLWKLNAPVSTLMVCSICKCGGIDRYTNQHGRDGSRLYKRDVCSKICIDGKVSAQAPQYLIYETSSLIVPLSTLTTIGTTALPCRLPATKPTGTNETIL